MSDIITKKDEKVIRFIKSLDRMSEGMDRLLASRKPMFGGERYITDKEVAERLRVCRRTMQEWRTNGLISYTLIGGKVLYTESDVQALLDKHHVEAFE